MEDCFTSLSQLDYPADRVELVLADNASGDGTVAYVREHFPGVRILEFEENYGFCAGNNRAAALSQSEFVAFLNPDMRVEPHRLSGLMGRIGMQEGIPIEHKMVSKAIERAQKQVEGQNFSIRKHLLEYDDVMNKQRESIYRLRREILRGDSKKEYIQEVIQSILDWIMENHTNKEQSPDEWDTEGFTKAVGAQFGLDTIQIGIDWDAINYDELHELMLNKLYEIYSEKEIFFVIL